MVFFFFWGGGGGRKNSWNLSGNNMCSKRCCLEEAENTILQNHIKREVKSAKTLALLTGISLSLEHFSCWLSAPYFAKLYGSRQIQDIHRMIEFSHKIFDLNNTIFCTSVVLLKIVKCESLLSPRGSRGWNKSGFYSKYILFPISECKESQFYSLPLGPCVIRPFNSRLKSKIEY